MRTISRLLIIVTLGVMVCLPVSAFAEIIFDNLAGTTAGGSNLNSSVLRIANSFTTDGNNYFLTKVTLSLRDATTGGGDGVEVSIFTDNSSEPGTMIGNVLTQQTTIQTTFQNIEFTPTPSGNIILNANSTYWVVLRELIGTPNNYYWDNRSDQTHLWAFSSDSGSSWIPLTGNPVAMRVEGSPVPLPPSALLLGSGLLGLGAVGWRRRRES